MVSVIEISLIDIIVRREICCIHLSIPLLSEVLGEVSPATASLKLGDEQESREERETMSACTVHFSPFDLYPKFYLDHPFNFRFPLGESNLASHSE